MTKAPCSRSRLETFRTWTIALSPFYGLICGSSSTNAETKDYLKQFMMPNATDKELDDLLVHYPENPSAGCPFDTGIKNMLGIVSSRGGRS